LLTQVLDHAGDLTVQLAGPLPRGVHRPLLDPGRVPGLLCAQPAAGVPGGGSIVRALVAVLRRSAGPSLRCRSRPPAAGKSTGAPFGVRGRAHNVKLHRRNDYGTLRRRSCGRWTRFHIPGRPPGYPPRSARVCLSATSRRPPVSNRAEMAPSTYEGTAAPSGADVRGMSHRMRRRRCEKNPPALWRRWPRTNCC
jgi:hypothetical protein